MNGFPFQSLPTLALLLGVAFFTACRRESTTVGALVVAIESMPQGLDPRFAVDATSERIDKLVFRSLTEEDEHQQTGPDLAVDWRMPDERTIVFRLGDATFADGTPVTSADVRATYESILDPATASPKRGGLEFLAGVDAPDPRTVVFRLREPFAPFLAATRLGILPAASIRDPTRGLVGAGPFAIAAVVPNHEVRLRALAGRAALEEIRFRVIPDDTTRALETRKRTVHLVENAIEPQDLGWLAREAGICVRRDPGTTFHYLGLNLRDERLRKVEVRRAIALALDRKGLVEHLLNGTARVATGLLAPTHWAYEGDVRVFAHDPPESKRLLDAAGYPDPDGDGPAVRFRLAYKTTPVASRRRIAEAIQAELADVGIGVDVQSFEWGTFYDDVRRGNFQLYSLAWVGVSDPDIFFDVANSNRTPPAGNNRGGYASAEMDRLTVLGRRTLDPIARQRIYADVQKLAAEDLPFIPLWWTDNVVVQDERLCGFVPHPDGDLVSLRTAWWVASPPARPDGGRGACGCPRPMSGPRLVP